MVRPHPIILTTGWLAKRHSTAFVARQFPPRPRRVQGLPQLPVSHPSASSPPMTSPLSPPAYFGRSPYRRGSFLLGSEDATMATLAPKGTASGFAMLIKHRSSTPLHPAGDDEEGGLVDWALRHMRDEHPDDDHRSIADERRVSAILNAPHMRSLRLIGNNNPRYRWQRYWKTDEELGRMKPKIRKYYERTNFLVQQYLYIDRLLDSSLPHDLLNEYNNMPASAFRGLPDVPATIAEEPTPTPTPTTYKADADAGGSVDGSGDSMSGRSRNGSADALHTNQMVAKKVKRTPKDIYRPTETTPLFMHHDDDDDDADEDGPRPDIPWLEDDEVDSSDRIVAVAIYVNFAANCILLLGKIAVIISVPSVSVLASLVDAVLDFLSTAIVWTTTWLIARQDQYSYPVGRRRWALSPSALSFFSSCADAAPRLEPLGVLVFSVIMITSFVQVSLEAIQRLASPNHDMVKL